MSSNASNSHLGFKYKVTHFPWISSVLPGDCLDNTLK